MDNVKTQFDFAPKDLTDRRAPLEWKTKYPLGAWILIIIEVIYILVHLFGIPILMFLFWLKIPKNFFHSIDGKIYEVLAKYVFAWLGGMFGGTIFDLKWLYHSVAKQIWHIDRILWRILEPHLSGGLALVFMILLSSGILPIFDQDFLELPTAALGIGVMVGLFSDNATAKLAKLSAKIFGPSKEEK